MMWFLQGSKGEKLFLSVREYFVSRTEGDIILNGDQSVSRKHAKITVQFEKKYLGKPNILPVVTVTDTGSRYGTFVNGDMHPSKRLAEGYSVELKNGDKVRFGLQWNIWTLRHFPLVVTTSTLNTEQKANLIRTVAGLGGHIVSDWQDSCTHVTMPKVTLTVKVVCALAMSVPIVTPVYWQAFNKAVVDKKPLPDAKDYLPALVETILNANRVSFHPNEARRRLFAGKLFLFSSSSQFKMNSCMVTAAGGNVSIVESCRLSWEQMLEPNIIVMQYVPDKHSQDFTVPEDFENLQMFLTSKGKRVIPDSEIGLAILFCSTEKNCNPDFSMSSLLHKKTQSDLSVSQCKVLAPETQSGQNSFGNETGKTIPDSMSLRSLSVIPDICINHRNSHKDITVTSSICTMVSPSCGDASLPTSLNTTPWSQRDVRHQPERVCTPSFSEKYSMKPANLDSEPLFDESVNVQLESTNLGASKETPLVCMQPAAGNTEQLDTLNDSGENAGISSLYKPGKQLQLNSLKEKQAGEVQVISSLPTKDTQTLKQKEAKIQSLDAYSITKKHAVSSIQRKGSCQQEDEFSFPVPAAKRVKIVNFIKGGNAIDENLFVFTSNSNRTNAQDVKGLTDEYDMFAFPSKSTEKIQDEHIPAEMSERIKELPVSSTKKRKQSFEGSDDSVNIFEKKPAFMIQVKVEKDDDGDKNNQKSQRLVVTSMQNESCDSGSEDEEERYLRSLGFLFAKKKNQFKKECLPSGDAAFREVSGGTVVEHKSLVVPGRMDNLRSNTSHSFKTFVKLQPYRSSIVPKIIGESDMVLVSGNSKLLTVLGNFAEEQEEREQADQFTFMAQSQCHLTNRS